MLVSPFHSWNGKVQLRENGGNFLSGLFQGAWSCRSVSGAYATLRRRLISLAPPALEKFASGTPNIRAPKAPPIYAQASSKLDQCDSLWVCMRRIVRAIAEALLHAGLAIGLRLVIWSGLSAHVKYVSSDGGFEYEESFKGGHLFGIKDEFELYKSLRNDPNLRLYRTTKLSPFRPFNLLRLRYRYNDSIRANPIDGYTERRNKAMDEYRKKAVEEYLPRLPSPGAVDGIRLFFYNQYNRNEVSIYGIYLGMVFGFTIRHNTRSMDGNPIWEFPAWRYSPGVNRDDPNWERVRYIVYKNRQVLIQYWDSHYDEIVKRFDRRYDGLF
jgi:hypothetical protein